MISEKKGVMFVWVLLGIFYIFLIGFDRASGTFEMSLLSLIVVLIIVQIFQTMVIVDALEG